MRDSRTSSSSTTRSSCPDCEKQLKLLRIINGRAGAEYWTLRCIGCGGIHLDIVNAQTPAPAPAA